ncbi:ubiquitin-specific protease UBP2 PWA37_005191 [Arxiozyma heterogenica]|uniref:ubiquitin-specific protease UBP2 n=1 Tax=Arxiozyma heterogenica TaxID=278026 RepID=UPI002EDD6604
MLHNESIGNETPLTNNIEATKTTNVQDDNSIDDGKQLLYVDLTSKSIFKTTDRLIDDVLCDLVISLPKLNTDDDDNNNNSDITVLNSSPLRYSKLRQFHKPLDFGTIMDQITLQTKFEYSSLTCPQYNKIQVLMGVLFDSNINNDHVFNTDGIIKLPIYQLKITVKTRSHLELYKRHVGISQYFRIHDLHPFDRKDLLIFDPKDPNLIDHAIYVSSDTNRLILIEIFKPELNSQEEMESLLTENIKKTYHLACESFKSLDPSNVPTQLDCINTLLKLFKGPLIRKSASDPLRVISADNVALNSHLNPNWLVEKYGFHISNKNNDNVNNNDGNNGIGDSKEREINEMEYIPPDFTDSDRDWRVRKQKESFIRKCLHLVFLGKRLITFMSSQNNPDLLNKDSKSYKALNLYTVQISTKPLFQLLGEVRSNFALTSDQTSLLDVNYHFINLSSSYYYTDRDIILNYETSKKVDEQNTGIYFDALTFIANRKGSYQLLGYCGKQDLVGQEMLESALRVFKIDPTQIDSPNKLDENLILSMYQHEQMTHIDSNSLTDLKNALRVLAKYKKSDFLQFYVTYEPYKSLSQAYSELEIDESVDDDIVQTAYTIKVNDSPGLKLECTRALYTIALHKRSMALFNFLMDQCSLFSKYYGPEKYSYREALNMIQVNENANDEVILKIFQQKWEHESLLSVDQLLNLKAALSKICFETNSKLISNFIETGLIDPNCLPPENWPTGLNNIGNTCYLNSLLQYYFAIAPLREYICQYHNTLKDFIDMNNNSNIIKKRRIGGREVSDSEVERSIQFTYQLRDLFQKMIYSRNRCVTPTQELAYLAFAPSNVEVEFEMSSPDTIVQEDDGVQVDYVETTDMEVDQFNPIDLQNNDIMKVPIKNDDGNMNIDTSLVDEDRKSVNDHNFKGYKNNEKNNRDKDPLISTKVAKISIDQLENTLEIGRQQDVTECIGNVLYQLESASEPVSLDEFHEQDDLIKQLFYGKTKQDIIPIKDSHGVRVKYERFLSLMVTISDHPRNIYDALDAYFMDEYLNLEEYGDVKRTLSITEFPTILQIQIQRVYYDRERFIPFKSIDPLPYPQTIYMDRYAETQDIKLVNRRKEANEMKQRLKELQFRQKELLSRNEVGLSRKDAYSETVKFLKSDVLENCDIDIPELSVCTEALVTELENVSNDINKELSELYESITQLQDKIDHQFDEFQSIAYTLFAVFIHRGEASYGHYWVYIKDLQNNGTWRKYNDETVSEIHEDEVFNFLEGNTATPYFLVLVKKDRENDIEPLKRIIEDEMLD